VKRICDQKKVAKESVVNRERKKKKTRDRRERAESKTLIKDSIVQKQEK